jgi:uncharacterized protein (TIGR03086 family)
MTIDLSPTAERVADLVAAVRDDQLGAPTPCETMDVATLLDHLDGLSQAFTMAATKDLPEGGTAPPSPSSANLDPEFRTVVPERLRTLAAAWQADDAWTGMTQAGGIDLPGEVGGLVALDEIALHGWDLAVATGQRFDLDPASADAVHEFVSGFAGPGHEADRAGLFGPEVPVPTDAPLFDRILGMAGRDPSWQPPAH